MMNAKNSSSDDDEETEFVFLSGVCLDRLVDLIVLLQGIDRKLQQPLVADEEEAGSPRNGFGKDCFPNRSLLFWQILQLASKLEEDEVAALLNAGSSMLSIGSGLAR